MRVLTSYMALLALLTAADTWGQRGDKAGEVQASVVPQELIPPAPVLSPDAALRSFQLKPGFAIELVASEPLIENPVALAFDPEEGIWVVEMCGYMPNVDGEGEQEIPGRVAYLRDTNGDGRMDVREVFLDGLVLPRAIALVHGGVLVAEPPHLWYCQDTDGDHVCDEKTEISSKYGRQGNPEHTANGLLWALDNWLYSANHNVRYRRVDGAWLIEPTPSRGQWGITQDDFGRLFFNSNSDQLRGDFVPSHYLRQKGKAKQPGINKRIATDQSTYPARVTPGVNRGYRKGILRQEGTLARFTAACGPCIYRGDMFPEEFRGNAFVCEPAGHLVKRDILEDQGGVLTAKPAYPDSEFLTSTDERFRPVNLYNGPDGALYVVDLYHGILQHRLFVTSYLREQILDRGLDQPAGLGRIYRVVYKPTRVRSDPPRLGGATAAELVRLLDHPNGWWRDTAQRLLIEKQALDVVSELKTSAGTTQSTMGRLHALWTLDGLGQLDSAVLETALNDPHPQLRAAALRLSEPELASPSPENEDLRNQIYAIVSDPAPEVQMQLALSLGQAQNSAGRGHLESLRERDGLVGDLAAFSLMEDAEPDEEPPQTQPALTAAETEQIAFGKTIYEVACLACHQPHGLGQPGLAPPLVGSEWLAGSPEMLARIVLHGLRGAITVKGETFQLEMPALGVLSDEQIAGALSYARNSWGNRYSVVSPETLKQVREATVDRLDAWTVEELLKLQESAAGGK